MNTCKICKREFNIILPDELCADCRRTLEALLKPTKFCSANTCNDSEPHFHCSECQSKNGHHSQQCKYKISRKPRIY